MGQCLFFPAFSLFNFSHLCTFSIVRNIGPFAAVNVGPLIYTQVTYCYSSNSAINISLHVTPLASLKDVLHGASAPSCIPPVSILLLGPFVSTMTIEVCSGNRDNTALDNLCRHFRLSEFHTCALTIDDVIACAIISLFEN